MQLAALTALTLEAWSQRRSPSAWEKKCRSLVGGAPDEETSGLLQDILLRQLLCGAHPSPQIQAYLRHGLHSGLIAVPSFVERVCNEERWRRAMLNAERPVHFTFILQLLEELLPKLPASARGADGRLTPERALRTAAVMLEAWVALAEGGAEARDTAPDGLRRCNELLQRLQADPSVAALVAVASGEMPEAWERFQRARRRARGEPEDGGGGEAVPGVWPAAAMWRLSDPHPGLSGHSHSLVAAEWMLWSLASGEACVAAWLGPEERLERLEDACGLRGWAPAGPHAAFALWAAALRIAPRPGAAPEPPPQPRRAVLLSLVPGLVRALRERAGPGDGAGHAERALEGALHLAGLAGTPLAAEVVAHGLHAGALRADLLPPALAQPPPPPLQERSLEEAQRRVRSKEPGAGLEALLAAAAGGPHAPHFGQQEAAARALVEACDPLAHGEEAPVQRALAAAAALLAAEGAVAAVALHGLLRPLAAGLGRACEAAEGAELAAAVGALGALLERTVPRGHPSATPPEAQAAEGALEAAPAPHAASWFRAWRAALAGGDGPLGAPPPPAPAPPAPAAGPAAEGSGGASASKGGAEAPAKAADVIVLDGDTPTGPAADLPDPPAADAAAAVEPPKSPAELPLDTDGLLDGIPGLESTQGALAALAPQLAAVLGFPAASLRSSPAPVAGAKRKREEDEGEGPEEEGYGPDVPLPDRLATFVSRHGQWAVLEALPGALRRAASAGDATPLVAAVQALVKAAPGAAHPAARWAAAQLRLRPAAWPRVPHALSTAPVPLPLAVLVAVSAGLAGAPELAFWAAAPALREAVALVGTPGPAEAPLCDAIARALANKHVRAPLASIQPQHAGGALRTALAALMHGPPPYAPAAPPAASYSTALAPPPFAAASADAWGAPSPWPASPTPAALRAALDAFGGPRPLASAALAAVVRAAGELAEPAAVARAAELVGCLLADLVGAADGAARDVAGAALSDALEAAGCLPPRPPAPPGRASEARGAAALAHASVAYAAALLSCGASGGEGAEAARSTAVLAAELLEGRLASGGKQAPPPPAATFALAFAALAGPLAPRLGLAGPASAGPVRCRLAGALADAGASAAALSLLDPARDAERPLMAALACRVAERP